MPGKKALNGLSRELSQRKMIIPPAPGRQTRGQGSPAAPPAVRDRAGRQARGSCHRVSSLRRRGTDDWGCPLPLRLQGPRPRRHPRYGIVPVGRPAGPVTTFRPFAVGARTIGAVRYPFGRTEGEVRGQNGTGCRWILDAQSSRTEGAALRRAFQQRPCGARLLSVYPCHHRIGSRKRERAITGGEERTPPGGGCARRKGGLSVLRGLRGRAS